MPVFYRLPFSYKKVMYIEKGEAMKHYPLPRMPTRIP